MNFLFDLYGWLCGKPDDKGDAWILFFYRPLRSRRKEFLLVTPFYGVTRPLALYAIVAWKEEMDCTVLRILPLVGFQP